MNNKLRRLWQSSISCAVFRAHGWCDNRLCQCACHAFAMERRELQRTVSALIDNAPEWRPWLEGQLDLLDLE